MRQLAPFALEDLGTAPFRFVGTHVLRATPAAVFDEIRDPSLWFALMHRSVWMTGATSGAGAERDVSLRGFGTFRQHMLVWEPPVGHGPGRVAFTMVATTSGLVAQMGEDLRLEPHPGGTRFEQAIVARPAALARPFQPALRLLLGRMFARSMRTLAKRTVWSAGQLTAKHGT